MKQKAKPMVDCAFPRCEECEHYILLNQKMYCNVPMVISKQTWILTESLITQLNRRIADLESVVYDKL